MLVSTPLCDTLIREGDSFSVSTSSFRTASELTMTASANRKLNRWSVQSCRWIVSKNQSWVAMAGRRPLARAAAIPKMLLGTSKVCNQPHPIRLRIAAECGHASQE